MDDPLGMKHRQADEKEHKRRKLALREAERNFKKKKEAKAKAKDLIKFNQKQKKAKEAYAERNKEMERKNNLVRAKGEAALRKAKMEALMNKK